MQTCVRMNVQLHTFLTLALDEGEWLASCPGRINSGAYWIRSWMGPRFDVNSVNKKFLHYRDKTLKGKMTLKYILWKVMVDWIDLVWDPAADFVLTLMNLLIRYNR
jgi:hypothetical protein